MRSHTCLFTLCKCIHYSFAVAVDIILTVFTKSSTCSTLGSHPPIIRGIEIHSIDDEQNSIYLRVALDLLLSDSSLIFGMSKFIVFFVKPLSCLTHGNICFLGRLSNIVARLCSTSSHTNQNKLHRCQT